MLRLPNRFRPAPLGEPFSLAVGGDGACAGDLELGAMQGSEGPELVARLRYESSRCSVRLADLPHAFGRYRVSSAVLPVWRSLAGRFGMPSVGLCIDALPCPDQLFLSLPTFTREPGPCAPILNSSRVVSGLVLETPARVPVRGAIGVGAAYSFRGAELRAHGTLFSERLVLEVAFEGQPTVPPVRFDTHGLAWKQACEDPWRGLPPGMHISPALPTPPAPGVGLLASHFEGPRPAGVAPPAKRVRLGPEDDALELNGRFGARLSVPLESGSGVCAVTATFGPYRATSRRIELGTPER